MSKKGPTITYRNKNAFPSDYAAAEDLTGDTTGTIERVVMREIKTDDGGQVKLLIYFKDAPKPMICNKTNAVTIAGVTGEREVSKWPGHRITLYATTVSAFGDPHCPCIRVRDKAPKQPDKPPVKPEDPALKFRAWLQSKGIREIDAVEAINGTPIDSATDADWKVLRKWARTAKPTPPAADKPAWETDADAEYERARQQGELPETHPEEHS